MSPEAPTADTSSRIKRLVKHGAIYGLGSVTARLAGFLLLPVYTRVLTESELGVVWLLNTAAALLGTVLGFGFSSGLLRFYLATDDQDERDSIIASAFRFLSLAAIGVLSITAFFREPIATLLTGDPTHGPLVAIVLASTFFEVGLHVPLALFRANEMSARFVLTSLTRFLGTLGMALILVVKLEKGVAGVLLASLFGSGVLYVGLVPFIIRNTRGRLSGAQVKRLLHFGFPIMLATIGSFIIDTSDLWLLRWIRNDTEEVGVYGTIYRLAKITHVCLIQPFVLAWPAILFSTRDPEAQRRLCRQTLTYGVAAMAFAALVVTQVREPVIALLVTEEYLSASTVLPIVLFSFVFLLPYFVLNSGATIANRTHYMTWTLLVSVIVNVGVNLLLIPDYGMLGAAIGTLLAYIVMASVMYGFSQRAFPVPYDLRRVLPLIATAALAAVGGVLLERTGLSPWIARGAGIAAYVAMLTVLATTTERAFAARALRGELRIGR